MNELATSASGGEPSAPATGRSQASWGRLLLIVLCLTGVGAGGVYWWTFGGGEKWWHALLLPAQAEFRGRVTLDGEPLRGGQLPTWPDRGGVPRSVGFIGQDGEFILRTDIAGKFIERAFVGRHRVSVLQYAQQVGPSAPRLTSPAKYTSPDTSGLVMTVDRDPSKNVALLELLSDSQKHNGQQSRPVTP